MKWLRILSSIIILAVSIGIVVLIVFFKRNTPRQQAEYLYELQSYFSGGSLEESWLLHKAIELDSTFALAYRELATPYIYRGLFKEGMEYINQAVRFDPVQQLGYRGHVKLFVTKDYEGAIKDFLRLDSLTPNFRDAPWGNDIYFVMGLAYHGMGKEEKAEYQYTQSINLTSLERSLAWVNPEVLMYRGILYFEQGKYEKALEDFENTVKYSPLFTEGHYWEGKVLLELENYDTALEKFLKAESLYKEGYGKKHPFYDLPFQLNLELIQQAKREATQLAVL